MDILQITVVAPPISFSDDETGAQLTNFALEHCEPWVAQYQTIPWLAIPFTDDEILNFPRAGAVGQQIIILVRNLPRPAPFLDDEVLGVQPVQPIEEHEGWVAQYQTIPWLARPFMDDETGGQLKNFGLDQEEPWLARSQTILWNPGVFADEDIRGTPPTQAVDDERAWAPDREIVAWLARPHLDDEIGAQLKNFALDQQDDWNRAVQAILWRPAQFSEDELKAFPALDDEAPRPALSQQLQRWTDWSPANDEVLHIAALDEPEYSWLPRQWPSQRMQHFFPTDEICVFSAAAGGLLLARRRAVL